MSLKGLNNIFRFILEIIMLAVVAVWGWKQAVGPVKYLLAIGLPVVLGTLWGIFAVRDDPSRSGKTVVQTPGVLRLVLELTFFGSAVWAAHDMGYKKLSLIFACMILVHYIFSFKRINWLLKQN